MPLDDKINAIFDLLVTICNREMRLLSGGYKNRIWLIVKCISLVLVVNLVNMVFNFAYELPWRFITELMLNRQMSKVGTIVGKLGNLFKNRWERELISEELMNRDGSLTVDGRDVVLRLLAQKAFDGAYTDDGGADHASMKQFIGEGLVKRNKEISVERDEK